MAIRKLLLTALVATGLIGGLAAYTAQPAKAYTCNTWCYSENSCTTTCF